MTASTTSRTFDPSVSVLIGTDCDEFVCVSAGENFYAGAASWRTEVDEMYYVVVGGRYGGAGDFSLQIEVSVGFRLPLALFCQLFLTLPLQPYRAANVWRTTSAKALRRSAFLSLSLRALVWRQRRDTTVRLLVVTLSMVRRGLYGMSFLDPARA